MWSGRERSGMEGIVLVVGKLGSDGNVGFGKDDFVCGKDWHELATWVWVLGNGGTVGSDKFGTQGKGGICKRFQAAKPTLIHEKDKAIRNGNIKMLKLAIKMEKIGDVNVECSQY
ncbi:hypothetical protein Tsubulata_002117 [Turnera subulata]|uniref:Uncharacterized protein n=1 Tax=Turnera subulata TaxID=218843 RepID=A0A9Q0G1A2_9ROSI|nr:hypothetical protein Tsubulata_002117 [Turnera subulata]